MLVFLVDHKKFYAIISIIVLFQFNSCLDKFGVESRGIYIYNKLNVPIIKYIQHNDNSFSNQDILFPGDFHYHPYIGKGGLLGKGLTFKKLFIKYGKNFCYVKSIDFKDLNVKPDKKYRFRITIDNKFIQKYGIKLR